MVQRYKPSDLREACIQEALTIIETSGVEHLSLREVSRRLGVSHQAPYKHFASRDHILAEVTMRAFTSFATYLDEIPKTDHPKEDLRQIGEAYLNYARSHPLQYRLMFGMPLPNPQNHPEMMQSAQYAFSRLHDCVTRIYQQSETVIDSQVTLDALFIWSTMHGLAGILQTQVLYTLSLPDGILGTLSSYIQFRMSLALGFDDPPRRRSGEG